MDCPAVVTNTSGTRAGAVGGVGALAERVQLVARPNTTESARRARRLGPHRRIVTGPMLRLLPSGYKTLPSPLSVPPIGYSTRRAQVRTILCATLTGRVPIA